MEISQLRTLVHVAELGSLSKTADRLHIAQPALSRHIRLLEDELGVRLFDRHGRGMVLSDAGRDVLDHATRILNELELVRSSVRDRTSTLYGSVAIGMPPTVADLLAPRLASRIKTQQAQLIPRFLAAFTGFLVDWLQRGDVEIAVLYDPLPVRSLKTNPLLTETLVLVGPANAGLELSAAQPFSSVSRAPVLLPSKKHGLRGILDKCADECGVVLRPVVEADSFNTLVDLVREGFGMTILPLAPIHKRVQDGELSAAPLVDPAPFRRLVLARSADRPLSRAGAFANEVLTATVKELIDNKIWIGCQLEEL